MIYQNNLENKKTGFTLIELLAVIIIIGILMIIAIPSVTNYISNSRKSAYVDTAKNLIGSARVFVNSGKKEMYDEKSTYYIDYKCLKTENTSRSPYGEFTSAYVIVTYDKTGYKYYWISRDETGQGVKKITISDELDEEDIVSNIKETEIKPNIAVGGRESITIIDSNCEKKQGTVEKYVSESGNPLYTLTFNNENGVGCTKQNGEYKKEWGDLCIPSRNNYTFKGWFTKENGEGDEITSTSIVTDNLNVYAYWTLPPVCKRATTLHTKDCKRTSSGCYAAGYRNGKKITYGNDPLNRENGVLTPGDAFDCDVNLDGKYDPNTERFYYISNSYDTINNKFDTTKAALIYYTCLTNGNTPSNTAVIPYSTKNKAQSLGYSCSIQDGCNRFGPTDAYIHLPSVTQWKNDRIIYPKNPRQIRNSSDGTSTSLGTLVKFTYTDRAARLITYQEIKKSCASNLQPSGCLDSKCTFLLENVGRYETNNGIYGYWTETAYPSNSSYIYFVGDGRDVTPFIAAHTAYGVRPVIDVNISDIEY